WLLGFHPELVVDALGLSFKSGEFGLHLIARMSVDLRVVKFGRVGMTRPSSATISRNFETHLNFRVPHDRLLLLNAAEVRAPCRYSDRDCRRRSVADECGSKSRGSL